MAFSALLLGSIGVLAETHDLQREAFNAAFRDAGLDWHWADPEYSEMLKRSGGKDRIARYAAARQQDVDAEALHASKVEHFMAALKAGVAARPGVVEIMEQARQAGMKVGFVTSTGADQSAAVLDVLGAAITAQDFDFIGNRAMVTHGKPAPEIYQRALKELGVAAHDALAVEDTPVSSQSPLAAGITTVGFPGIAAKGQGFPPGVETVAELHAGLLGESARAA